MARTELEVLAMVEVGLVRFAGVALEVAGAAIPRYRSKFSKHIFTQPQLLATLCLMRYEDWTFREVEVRLAEHSELWEALGLSRVPDYTTLYRFLRRLDERILNRALAEAAGCLPAPPGGATLAVDGTGLPSSRISSSSSTSRRPPLHPLDPSRDRERRLLPVGAAMLWMLLVGRQGPT